MTMRKAAVARRSSPPLLLPSQQRHRLLSPNTTMKTKPTDGYAEEERILSAESFLESESPDTPLNANYNGDDGIQKTSIGGDDYVVSGTRLQSQHRMRQPHDRYHDYHLSSSAGKARRRGQRNKSTRQNPFENNMDLEVSHDHEHETRPRAQRRSSLPANISFGLPNNSNNIQLSTTDTEKLEWIHQQTKHHRMVRERLRQSSFSDGSSIPQSITTRSSFSQLNSQPLLGGFPRNRSSESLAKEAHNSSKRVSKGENDQNKGFHSPGIDSRQDHAENGVYPNVEGVRIDDTKQQSNDPKIRQKNGMKRGSLDSSLMRYIPKRTSQSSAAARRSNSLDLSNNQRDLAMDSLLGGQKRPHSDDKEAEERKRREHKIQADIAKFTAFPGQVTGMGENHEGDSTARLRMGATHKGGESGPRNSFTVTIPSRTEDEIRSVDRGREKRKVDSVNAKHHRRGHSAEIKVVPQLISFSSDQSIERKRNSKQDYDVQDIELGKTSSDENHHHHSVRNVSFRLEGIDVSDRPLSKTNRVRKTKDKKKSASLELFRVTPLVGSAACLCYCISVLLAGGLGFWLHKSLTVDELRSPTLRPSSNDVFDNGGSIESKITPPTMMAPSVVPSLMPSTTSFPTLYPSIDVTSIPSQSFEPTLQPSEMPSSKPTSIPVCPDELLNSVSLDDDSLLNFKYEVILSSFYSGGGMLCASLGYAGIAGWIGVAFSTASRDPQFGLKEAVIGIPGIQTTTAVARDGSAELGQQGDVVLDDIPTFMNPAKYLIPAGGIEAQGFLGPSLKLLRHVNMQTLVNASVSIFVNPFSDDDMSSLHRTQLSFAKFLQEPNEVGINPCGSNLLLFAVAAVNDDGEYDGNPEWKSVNLLLDCSEKE